MASERLRRISRASRLFTAIAALCCATTGATGQRADHWENLVIPQHRVVLPPESESSVRIESVDVRVKIDEQVATTTVAIQLRNPSGRQQESQLLMPVPDGASVRQFRLEGLPDEGIARMLTREEARRIYESIVRRTRDPGLVEFVGFNLIRSSVFPVPANGTQRMELVYEQVLPADGARVDYVLPRSESLERSHIKWSLTATVSSSRAIGAVYSPSHELATERLADGSVRLTVPASSANDPGAFRLSFVLAEPDGLSATVIAYPDPKVGDGRGGYFMLLLDVPSDEDRAPIRREVTLVIDRSGSMRGEKLEQAKNAAMQIIESLDEGEYFNIVDYSDTIESFTPSSVPKSAETLRRVREYIASIKAVGGTNIHDALVHALRAEPAEEALPMVLFLTDGLPTVGERSERAIREAARSANEHGRRIFSFGVGFDVNAPLLTGLSDGSRGAPTFVQPDEDIETKVGQVFRRLKGPILAMPELTFAGAAVREIMPGSLGDVFEGDQISVFGQFLAEDEVVFTLTGTDAAGHEAVFEVTYDFGRAEVQHGYVARIWATRKIGTLINEIRQSGTEGGAANQELVDEVIRLSTEFGVLTEYTAFLAAEENEFLGQFGELDDLSITAGLPATRARRMIEDSIDERAVRLREGGGGVSQDTNLAFQREAKRLNSRNSFYYLGRDGEGQLETASFVSVRQVADQTFYRRGERWVDAALLELQADEPERTIEFASDEYFELLQRFARERRQSVLAASGDIYLMLDGQRTLIRQAPTEDD